MSGKMPPAPPENRSHKGTGDAKPAPKSDVRPEDKLPNLEQQGRHGNLKQNTTNQAHQQDS